MKRAPSPARTTTSTAVRLGAFALAILGHAALLAALSLPRTSDLPLSDEPPLLVTLAGDGGGGTPAPSRSSSRVPAESPTPPELPEAAPPPPPDLTHPVIEPPPPDPELAGLPVMVRALMATGPRLDQEPDPVTTGDSAAAGTPGLPGEPGVECPLAGVLRQVLEQDPALQASLARIGPEHRSVAGAVMLWNGAWPDPERIGGTATIDSVRSIIATGLESAAEACGAQVISGPIFLPVASRSGTLVLALGSGEWRWADLLAQPLGSNVQPLRSQPLR